MGMISVISLDGSTAGQIFSIREILEQKRQYNWTVWIS